MAYTYQTDSGVTLIVPDSSIEIYTNVNTSANATNGVIAIVGESDAGPSFSQDQLNGQKVSANSYGPADINKVLAKYKSGRIVDAFQGAVAAYSAGLTGAFNRIILVKTNDSAQAQLALSTGQIVAKIGGLDGNNIQLSVASSTPEQAPTTGQISYVPNSTGAMELSVKVNGYNTQALPIPVNSTPAALAAGLANLDDILVQGGVDRQVLAGLVGQNISLAQAGQIATVTLQLGQTFSGAPKVGDTVQIPSGSVIEGATQENVGYYVVTSVTNTNSSAAITMKRASLAAMADVTSTPIVAVTEITCSSFLKISNASGTDRNVLDGLAGVQASVAAALANITVKLATGDTFSGTPTAGDYLYIPTGSPYAGGSSQNVGYYEVLSVNNTAALAQIVAARLSNGAPVSVVAAAITASSNLMVVDKQIQGVAKSLEITSTGAQPLSDSLFVLGTTDAASALGVIVNSSVELKKTIVIKNIVSGIQELFQVGGYTPMKIGYEGTTADLTIAPDVNGKMIFSTVVTGGSGGNISIDLSQVNSLGQLISMINQNPGYSAVAATAAAASLNPSRLDQVTASFATDLSGGRPLGIKTDASDLAGNIKGLGGSQLAFYNASIQSGLPNDMKLTYLTGGVKGGTSGLEFANAINALSGVRCNFVVPCVSQDASADFAEGSTELASSYSVDAVNEAVKTHCLAMSTAKIKRHRVGIVSKRGTFDECMTAAQNMASARIAMSFQDVTTLNTQGQVVKFQPWMASVKAASMQTAAQYRGIFGPRRVINISNATVPFADFDEENMTDLEDALLAGLLPISKNEQGNFNFSSDQTTYSIPDNNFIYNSLQGMYVGDLIALDLAESLKNAFIGESNADVTEAVAINFVKTKMNQYLNSKWTAPSGQYVAGWKSIVIKINGPVMQVSACVVESSALKFIVIDLTLEGVQSGSTGTTASGRS